MKNTHVTMETFVLKRKPQMTLNTGLVYCKKKLYMNVKLTVLNSIINETVEMKTIAAQFKLLCLVQFNLPEVYQ